MFIAMSQKRGILIRLLVILSLPVDKCERRYYSRQWWDHWVLSGGFPYRIAKLMIGHYEDLSRKTEFIHYISFTYEESPEYEMGYIMGEIIERYRKMVEHLRRPVMYKSEAVFATIKRLQLIEMLYFEVYHLANMMHEIPKKYGFVKDMSKRNATKEVNEAFDNNQKAVDAQNQLANAREEREKRKKKKIKEMKKLRELILKGEYQTNRTVKPRNRWWPIDYGWEIDYYW